MANIVKFEKCTDCDLEIPHGYFVGSEKGRLMIPIASLVSGRHLMTKMPDELVDQDKGAIEQQMVEGRPSGNPGQCREGHREHRQDGPHLQQTVPALSDHGYPFRRWCGRDHGRRAPWGRTEERRTRVIQRRSLNERSAFFIFKLKCRGAGNFFLNLTSSPLVKFKTVIHDKHRCVRKPWIPSNP